MGAASGSGMARWLGAAVGRLGSVGALATEPAAQPRTPGRALQLHVIAIATVAAATGVALLLQHYQLARLPFAAFLLEIAIVAWYLGVGPAMLAVVLSGLTFDYFFLEPLHTFAIVAADIPYFITFLLFASLITGFSAVRRRFEEQLVKSREDLRREVTVRTQQASLLDLTHDSIFVRDMEDRITYWNRGAQELYGWTPEEAVGKVSYDLLQTEFLTPLDEIRGELLRANRWEGELRQRKADGTVVVVSSRWSLRRDEEGRPLEVLETGNDVTDRKRREEELSATNKELEAFAYAISHDLRAPLRHMVGYTELLQKHAGSALDEKARRFMATIVDSTKRMGTLIDDLLSFSRIGRAETRETTVSMDQLVKEVRDEMQPETKGREIAWRIGDLPELYGDRSMLRLAFVNLLSNAVKFTRKRPLAQIEIGCLEKKDEAVTLFVKDNGVGFDMKYVNKLFGVFQRLHRADLFEGTGIGLATVQRIIHRHGGRVWAEGLVDSGATFFIVVPNRSKSRGLTS
jgi:PAS domain S-box-containing protein